MKYFAAVLHHMQRIPGFDAEGLAETRSELEALEQRLADLQRQIDALDPRHLHRGLTQGGDPKGGG